MEASARPFALFLESRISCSISSSFCDAVHLSPLPGISAFGPIWSHLRGSQDIQLIHRAILGITERQPCDTKRNTSHPRWCFEEKALSSWFVTKQGSSPVFFALQPPQYPYRQFHALPPLLLISDRTGFSLRTFPDGGILRLHIKKATADNHLLVRLVAMQISFGGQVN